MGGPADVRLHSDAALRLFTEEEANALLPQLEEIFLLLDPKLARLRELKELIEDSEAYHGEGLSGAPARTASRMRTSCKNNPTWIGPSKRTLTRSWPSAAR